MASTNYDGDNLQPWSMAVVICVTALAAAAVGLRMLSRFEKKTSLWWDDWMILFSMAWNLMVVGFIFAMLRHGMGLHASTLRIDDIIMIAKYLVVAEILYVFNLVWTKLSFLLMFYRIFHFGYFKKWAYIIGTFVIAWVVCVTFLFVFICVPVEKLWYPDLPGHCIDQVGTWIANAASTIVTDLAILVLPIPQIWSLQLKTRQKVALTIMFGLGFFVIFASAYRFTVLFSYSAADPSYTLAPTVVWTAIEMSAGIISACLPTMGPAFILVARILGVSKVLGLTTNRSVNALPSRNHSKLNRNPQLNGGANGRNRKEGGNDIEDGFFRLSDDTNASRVGDTTGDVRLRPEHDVGFQSSTAVATKGEADSWSGDEVPLRRIRVQTDVKQVRGE
ncbi:uncharacterized protein BCR38DRAFT_353991 [Pseudomassariella vexata]|uniref:Rhodopsin domain-containing protein n=1 Tax=Pseudomassariella vexata TaxID=1141098 RepID=A0A1Y2DET8_9PEZI|nr:uncharacterized protein BCR38DRAFT_353991 [Pseudomassariella vexata]ORY57802.1 hypothetical protein BCR38DRAFT_353991 [Pseudomassariella vexata]